MTCVEYRRLRITYWKNGLYKKRRRADWFFEVHDSAEPEPWFIDCERAETHLDSFDAGGRVLVEFLNRLGAEGWKVISYRGRRDNFDNHDLYSPGGVYLLMREVP